MNLSDEIVNLKDGKELKEFLELNPIKELNTRQLELLERKTLSLGSNELTIATINEIKATLKQEHSNFYKVIKYSSLFIQIAVALFALLYFLKVKFKKDNLTDSLSDVLRNKRINSSLKDKSTEYKNKYRNISIYYPSRNELKFYWKKEISSKAVIPNDCLQKEVKKIDLEGEAFGRFHNILDYAIKNNFNAFRIPTFKENNHQDNIIFFKCTYK